MAEFDPEEVFSGSRDGLISVENGVISIQDPEGLGRYPRLAAADNIQLYIEGELIEGEVIVDEGSQDFISWEIVPPESHKEFSLEVEEEGLKAYLGLKLIPEQKLRLKDKGPDNMITLETEVISEEYPDLSKSEILDFLKGKGITYGIKPGKIEQLVENPDYHSRRVLIAEGKPCQNGRDARIIPSQLYKKHREQPFNTIDSLASGEIICYKKPKIEGRPGKNVYGETLTPPPVQDREIQAGDNVIGSDDGFKAIAQTSGQPKIKKLTDGVRVSIVKQYIIEGDIDKYTGNIKYEGDLLITGSINDYFNVKVGHDLKVGTSIANAEVACSGSVYVRKNIIASNVNVGDYLNHQLVEKFQKIAGMLDDLFRALEEITDEARRRRQLIKNVNRGKLIKLLILNKFSRLPHLIKETYGEIDEKLNEVQAIFQEVLPYIQDLRRLEKLGQQQLFEKFYRQLQQVVEKNNDRGQELNIYTGYIQNSTINVRGSLIISQQGCYNSEVNCRGSIIGLGASSFLRGGRYRAGDILFVNQVGNRMGKTYLRVGGHLYVERVTGTVSVKSPHDRHLVEPPCSGINLRVDKQGKLHTATRKPDIEQFKYRDDDRQFID